ncbi:hypothetical protein CHLNCDRAFT_29116 [Chlorella variabilis]|uniref:Urease accessory protein UreD n=1 Tax=Chlorella variabilis TaxID=554065 RepID=E1ZUR7_CHLVA|nr:hypothetical protein CHLNCDRAFT_29116 [Chlorella variabilis]EFN50428.1 hypothetical protein CHLNCDRAFT_29116 [Chlorella variabilis]|eukprot:XP_005842560.1 hypothetical protein CHLNCDRAFT_29116 [Chlorella variabilis]
MDGPTNDFNLQRSKGDLQLKLRGDKIERLFQSGCARIILPKTYDAMKEAVILNTAGGITGGDELKIQLRAEACALVVTTQAAERLYKSISKSAKISIDLQAKTGTSLHWLPQETIVFDGAKVDRTIKLNMSADSQCLLAETIILGREAMGERITRCHFTDNWRLFRDGQLFHAESMRLAGEIEKILEAIACGNGGKMFTTILYSGDDIELRRSALNPIIEQCASNCAASYWKNKLVFRLVSRHPLAGKADVKLILASLRDQPLPRVWNS